MATAEEIAVLRAKINQLDNTDPYTDEALDLLIDAANGDTDEVAGAIWGQKAASFSTLVDISESGSSRKMGDLYKNAMAMANFYSGKAKADDPVPAANRARTRAIERL